MLIFSASSATSDHCWWIGGYRNAAGKHSFMWSDGSGSSHTDWNTNQPDNNYDREAFVQICKCSNRIAWNDNANNHPSNYICQLNWVCTHKIKYLFLIYQCALRYCFDKNKSFWCKKVLTLFYITTWKACKKVDI